MLAGQIYCSAKMSEDWDRNENTRYCYFSQKCGFVPHRHVPSLGLLPYVDFA